MSQTNYLFDNEWKKARERLSTIELMEDPATLECLERIGVAPGWHCLEIGGGGGSITQWLCNRVGCAGHVVATDINTCFLKALNFSHLEVREHDIVTDPLEATAFDLVHTRNLLIHLPERRIALQKMATAVKPGGWILVEEVDFITEGADPLAPPAWRALYAKLTQALYRVCEQQDIDLFYGTRVLGLLRGLGFEALHAVGRTQMVLGGSPEATLHRLTFEQVKESVLALGRVTGQEFDEFIALLANPAFAWRWDLRVSTWGRRPQSGRQCP